MSAHPEKLWIILGRNNRVINMTTDESHLSFIKKYVQQAQEVGDDWQLVEYKLSYVYPSVIDNA